MNTKIEAADLTNGAPSFLKNMLDLDEEVEMPDHDCPAELLREQQEKMGEYLYLLELRAVIEKIDLEEE